MMDLAKVQGEHLEKERLRKEKKEKQLERQLQERKEDLLSKQENMRKEVRESRKLRKISFINVLIFAATVYIFYSSVDVFGWISVAAVGIGSAACIYYLMIAVTIPKNHFELEIQEIENELDLLSVGGSSIQERAEKLFKHHHLELKRYYDENLRQSKWVFSLGIACILIGFAIIGATFYLINEFATAIESQIIIGVVGAISAILTNFIAAIFIKMHAESVKSLTEFHNRFVNTHHYYFGNYLISKIKDETKREGALSKLALNIHSTSSSKVEELKKDMSLINSENLNAGNTEAKTEAQNMRIVADELEKWDALLKKKIINQAEFDYQKNKLLFY